MDNIGCRICHDVDQEIPVEKETVIELNTSRWDTDNIHQGNKMVCNTPGVYLIMAECIWSDVCIESVCQITIKVNGDRIIATDRRQGMFLWSPFNNCSTIWKMEKGDYVEFIAWYWQPPSNIIELPCPKIRRAEHLDSPEFMMQRIGYGS